MKLSVTLLQLALFAFGALAVPIDGREAFDAERRGEAANAKSDTDATFIHNWGLKREEAVNTDATFIHNWGLKRGEPSNTDEIFVHRWGTKREEASTDISFLAYWASKNEEAATPN